MYKKKKSCFLNYIYPRHQTLGVILFFLTTTALAEIVLLLCRARIHNFISLQISRTFFFFLSPSRGRKVYEQSETSIHQSDLTAPGQVGTFYSACALVHVNIAWLGQWEPHIARLPFRININNKRGKEKEAVFYRVYNMCALFTFIHTYTRKKCRDFLKLLVIDRRRSLLEIDRWMYK